MKLLTDIVVTIPTIACIGIASVASAAIGFAYGFEAGLKYRNFTRLVNRFEQVESQLLRAWQVVDSLVKRSKPENTDLGRLARERAERWLKERH